MLLLIIHLQFAAAFTFYLQATREREGKVITGKHTHTHTLSYAHVGRQTDSSVALSS